MLLSAVKKMVGPMAPTRYQFGYGFTTLHVALIALLSFLIGFAVANYGRTVAEMFVESKPDLIIQNMTHGTKLEGLSQLWTTRR